ncbi:MAG: arginine--tRNA ligase [Bacteroidota bacterium]
MLPIFTHIQQSAASCVKELYDTEIDPSSLSVQETRKEFEGDFTLVVFPLTRYKLGSPVQIGETLGKWLVEHVTEITKFNVIKGFLNLSLSDTFWYHFLAENYQNPAFLTRKEGNGQAIVVEFCSPNTNKPLHLGHLRNIVLGDALTRILGANGYKAIPTCLFNDRGTNISKSMYAWLDSHERETPESSGKKGDKLVGDYYVAYANRYKEEVAGLKESGLSKEEAEQQAPSQLAIRELTRKWEAGDPETLALWTKMNGWVYEAMEYTFERLGVKFDTYYYESQVYKKGKETVQEGLSEGIFYQKEDGSIWVDLSGEGLDQKLVLRKDGTSIYITQDLAIADAKYDQYKMNRSVYVVGNEQEYHFKVLFLILKKLGKAYSNGLFHLSYGMVDLPTGKMKSREGTTVEADDLIDEMVDTAQKITQELGKTEGMEVEELEKLYHTLGLGALKYFLVKVDPRKRILFKPDESIDINGHTGPFIQYAFTRTASLKRKGEEVLEFSPDVRPESGMKEHERLLFRKIYQYPSVLKDAAESYNPAIIANYAFELAKDFNRFWHGDKIIQSDQPQTSSYRFALAQFTGQVLKASMGLLGIDMPERM